MSTIVGTRTMRRGNTQVRREESGLVGYVVDRRDVKGNDGVTRIDERWVRVGEPKDLHEAWVFIHGRRR